MHPQISRVEECLSPTGLLAQHWPGYGVRPEQIRLALEVEQGVMAGKSLALEAPTGTGKTLSYLLPALLSGRRIILSVGNLTLQDHLLLGEYQKLRAVLPELRQLSVLKGCDNYFCHYRFEQIQNGKAQVGAAALVHSIWSELMAWKMQTRHGEIQTLPVTAEQISQLRPLLTLSADQCVGRRCPHFDNCYFQSARQRAASADVLLINHTLLLSDQGLFEKGMGALLPAVDVVIVDEAHQLPDLLVRRNTETMEEYGFQRWLKRVRRCSAEHSGLFADLGTLLLRLEQLWGQIRQQLLQKGGADSVQSVAPASFKPLQGILQQLQAQLAALHLAAVDVEKEIKQLQQWSSMFQQACDDKAVLYCDVDQSQLRIVAARLYNPFVSLNTNAAAWIYISATLMVDGSFDYFKRCLSLAEVETHHHQSAMDYPNRSLLWVPANLPLPADEDFYRAWADTLLMVADRLDGGMLLLFSSHDALQQTAEILRGRTDRTLLIYEPDSNRHKLLQQFRQDTSSLLLATGSFWEGIDVSGAALRCVAIDKLPFASPDDVLSLAWRYKASQEQRSLFNDYMVPNAITRLRQGVGRLLRSTEDEGLVVLGDTRILKKSYGPRFLSSLPPMPLAQSLQEVDAFLLKMGIGSDPL